MVTISEPVMKRIYLTAGVAAIIALTGIVLLITLAAIFPDKFESLGITIFHNRQTGVFADCFSAAGEHVPACKLEKQKASQKRSLDAAPDPKSIRKPRFTPFTFD